MIRSRTAVLYGMRAPKPYADSRPLKIEDAVLDAPGRGEVLVRIRAASLCHSDLSVIDGTRPWVMPMALGHEAAGIVQEVGPDVADLAPGDHVICVFVPSCGHCLPCREGRPAHCENGLAANRAGALLSGGVRLRVGGRAIHHHLGVSGFSEYAVVSRHSLVKVDPDIAFDRVALFGCAVLTGVGAVFNTARVQAGSTAAVVGLGGVGPCALLGALAAGARRVFAVDINPVKLALAKELGAEEAFDARDEETVERLSQAYGGGVDYAFETAGAVRALDTAFAVTRRGGATITSGLPDPDARLALSPTVLTAEERTLKGSYMGSCVPARDIPRLLEMHRAGRLPVDRLPVLRIALDDINRGFDELARGDVFRVMLTF